MHTITWKDIAPVGDMNMKHVIQILVEFMVYRKAWQSVWHTLCELEVTVLYVVVCAE